MYFYKATLTMEHRAFVSTVTVETNISTKHMRQKSASKATYPVSVRNQRDMNDSQLTRIWGARRIRRAHRSLKVLNIQFFSH